MSHVELHKVILDHSSAGDSTGQMQEQRGFLDTSVSRMCLRSRKHILEIILMTQKEPFLR